MNPWIFALLPIAFVASAAALLLARRKPGPRYISVPDTNEDAL